MSKQNQTRCDILGVQVDAMTISQSLEVVAGWVAKPAKHARIVIKPYVEFVAAARRDEGVAHMLNGADLSLADGVSLQWAASYLYGQPGGKPGLLKLTRSLLSWVQKPAWRDQILPERFAGITHTKPLLDLAEKQGWRVGIIGGKDPKRVYQAVSKRWPELRLVDTWTGYTMTTQSQDYTNWQADEQLGSILADIRTGNLDILLVGMGFPRQEYFMGAMKGEGLASVMIGEGGSFDYAELGGNKKRAPQAWRKFGVEWLWRLLLQPGRIVRQVAIPRFIWAVHTKAKRNYRAHNQEKP